MSLSVNDIVPCVTVAFCFHGYIAQQKKRTKIVATRHDFGAQNVPKMVLRPCFCPEHRWGSSMRPPRPSRSPPFPATSAVWEVWKVEGCREAEGKEGGRGREREGGGGRRSEGIDAPYLTRQGSGSAAKVMT